MQDILDIAALVNNNVSSYLTISVVYAENFHGGVHSVAHDLHLYLACALCDVTI